MYKKDWTFIDAWAKKIKAIKTLGGKCEKCSDDNIFHLTFHHINKDDKFMDIGKMRNHRWSLIIKELDKCKLLCRNCHQELHFNETSNKDNIHCDNKNTYLEYSNQKCEKCNYDKCSGSLVLHHIKGRGLKKFRLSSVRKKFIFELRDEIFDELNKCIVLCGNCHTEEHADIDKFNRLKEYIYKKEILLKEKKPKLNRNAIYELYDKGIKQAEISRIFETSRGTICDIIKKR